ncbi:MAG: tRNA (N6-threonylcarbamoyladenosine(37)-N6)-methyltransferase TrmO [Ardenticatenia bacterium]|jgi:tRNA-Thr(GGU) m(6)t(6)A37 methyltransferase TsaA|nr:MAG: tRNA (N6-threonylcarbamoyladenosine(37)-N6)-methyltransferase TrmO [Ardenticatenia bacterium]
MKKICYHPIGYVENEYPDPVAPNAMQDVESRIVLQPDLMDGLQGLTPGQYIMILFHLHRSQGYALLQHPRGDVSQPLRGVFALRSPHRPNPIGVSIVPLLAIEGNVLRVRGLDAINGTPVLDIKPAEEHEKAYTL